MDRNVCECNCGTRIDLDEQLLQERQMWKEKYTNLQEKVKVDIETMKQNIYAECSVIMQQEFAHREQDHTKLINNKNIQIKDLIARIINLETQVKLVSKEKEILEQSNKQQQVQIYEGSDALTGVKTRSAKNIRDWELKHEEQITNLKQRLASEHKCSMEKVEGERQILKQKLKEFQNKYAKLLPQIEKMRANLNAKAAQNQELVDTIEKLKKITERDLQICANKYEDLVRVHGTCSKQILKLTNENDQLHRDLGQEKKKIREVKVEPVYIDRPVEVEKVVEKVVHVEKLVNKYIDNPSNDKRIKQVEEQNVKLRDELNHVLAQIKDIEEFYKKSMEQLQENIRDHEKNVTLYKKQRESLAVKIGDQNKQLELMHSIIQKIGSDKGNRSQSENERIIVHVKQDGTYQKTVQKLPTQTPPVAPTSSIRKKK